MQVVYTRINKDLNGALPIEQAAYQPGHNTIEEIQTTQQITEKLIEFQQPCVILKHIILLIILKHLIQSIKLNFGKYSIISYTSIHPLSIY